MNGGAGADWFGFAHAPYLTGEDFDTLEGSRFDVQLAPSLDSIPGNRRAS